MIYAIIWLHLTKSDVIAYLLYESMYIKLKKKKKGKMSHSDRSHNGGDVWGKAMGTRGCFWGADSLLFLHRCGGYTNGLVSQKFVNLYNCGPNMFFYVCCTSIF